MTRPRQFESLRSAPSAGAPLRVVSLLPSATEIVCALGQRGALVGRSHECDFPEGLEDVPVCTASKLETQGTSYGIDERVKALVEEGVSIYRVSAEQLDALRPDVIVTQTQCDVCAASLKDVEEALCRMVTSHPRIVALSPNSLPDVWNDILHVAEALGVPEAGIALTHEVQARMAAVEFKARRLSPSPTVVAIEWIDPLMAGGNWMPELVDRAGGTNMFGEAGLHSPWLDWPALVEADPEVVVAMPCGWGIAKAREEMTVLLAHPEWSELRAVRSRRVYLADGNQFFNRPGPRIAESLEILAEMLWPDAFDYGHRGVGWAPL